MPCNAQVVFDALHDVLTQLGLNISAKKLVYMSNQAVCLGMFIDTVEGTVSILDEKLQSIEHMIQEWNSKTVCTKRQLQSLLGSLVYVHKCVKPAHIFLNRMLNLLRKRHYVKNIMLHEDFKCDLRWFIKFLPRYNGISMYAHKTTQDVKE